MTTGEKIKYLRKQLGMNAETLAEKIGVSAPTIYRYEKGDIEKFGYDRLIPLAEALHTTPTDLLCIDDDTEPKKEKDPDDQLVSLLTQLSKDEVTEVLRFISFLLSKRGG